MTNQNITAKKCGRVDDFAKVAIQVGEVGAKRELLQVVTMHTVPNANQIISPLQISDANADRNRRVSCLVLSPIRLL
jgi:hypothetical protein